MPHTYAIRLIEENVDLVTVLNSGVRPVADPKTFYIFDVDSPTTTTNHAIISIHNLQRRVGKDPASITVL